MGAPRKQRRKYERPTHPWKSERITEEKELCKKYGLKNRKEVWRVKSRIRRFRQQARNLLASSGEEIMKEKMGFFNKLKKLGIYENPSIEDLLTIKADDLLARRLQSQVYSRGIAKTMKEARQLITHNHVIVGNRIVNIPGYTVSKSEEEGIRLKKGMRVIKLGGKPESEKGAKEEKIEEPNTESKEPEKEKKGKEPKGDEKPGGEKVRRKSKSQETKKEEAKEGGEGRKD